MGLSGPAKWWSLSESSDTAALRPAPLGGPPPRDRRRVEAPRRPRIPLRPGRLPGMGLAPLSTPNPAPRPIPMRRCPSGGGGRSRVRISAERRAVLVSSAELALKGRNLNSLALQRQVAGPPHPIRPEGAEPYVGGAYKSWRKETATEECRPFGAD
jgi:hypothetical protein